MSDQYWSWLLGVVGVVGFILAGRKVWWSWYINLACQALWFAYAIVTEQYGFIATALVYTVVFGKNAISWTMERFNVHVVAYCGARWWRPRDWPAYGLYRNFTTGFSVGPWVFYTKEDI